MARAAASAALLNRELDSLSRESIRTKRSMSDIDKGVVVMGSHADRSGSQIDKLSGRVRILADVAAVLGPSLIPIGGVGIAAIGGLANQFGFAAIGAGTAVLAFQGVGDALKAVNKAAIEPTAANLDAAREALDKLGPSGRTFVAELRELIPQLKQLQVVAANGLLPGAAEGLAAITTVLPRLESIVSAVSTELGQIAADTGKSLASDRWEPFLEFIAAEAPKVLGDLSDIVGNTGHALAEMWMAFTPLNNGFSDWLVESTEELDKWAAGLSQTQGFQDFVAYIQDTGPQVAETFGAIGNAVVQIVEAASPLGGPVLQGIAALADGMAKIADSDLGTPLFTAVAALALFNRTMGVVNASRGGIANFGTRLDVAGVKARGFQTNLRQVRTDLALLATGAQVAGARTERELLRMNAASARLRANLAPVGKTGALLGGIGIAATGAADGIGLTNTASLALLGSIAGGPGVVAGGLIGAFLDAKAAGKGFEDAMTQADRAIKTGGVDEMTAALKRLKQERQDLGNISGVKDFFGDVGSRAAHPLATLGLGPSLEEQNEAKQRQLEFFGTIGDAINQVATDQDFLNEGFKATSTGLDTATQSAEDFKKAIEDVQAVLEGRSTFRDFEQSVDDFAGRLKKRGELLKELADAQARANGGAGLTASERNRLSKIQGRVESADTPAERKRALGDLRAFEATQAEQTSAERERAREDVKRLNEELLNYKLTLDTTTQAGRDNAEALDGIATSALNYANTIKDPVLKTAFLDNARDEFVKAAKAAGASDQAAKDLATQVGLLDGVKGTVKIVVDDNGTIRIIDKVQEKLDKLRREGAVKVSIQFRNDVSSGFGLFGVPAGADGLTVPGQRFPYGDRTLVLAAPGEEIITNRNGEADRFRRDRASGRIPRYADGGTVQPFSSSVSNTYNTSSGLSSRDLRAIATLVANSRQLYGDVHVHGDGAFRRELQNDSRMAASDGIQR